MMMICDLGDMYLLQGSTILVDLGSMVQIHFGLSGFVLNVKHEKSLGGKYPK
jgi:hypothetical protein